MGPPVPLLSLPPATKMVQFAGCPLRGSLPRVTDHDVRRVAPFGDPGIDACLPLPPAFRRWLRPSSASGPRGIRPAPQSLVSRTFHDVLASVLLALGLSLRSKRMLYSLARRGGRCSWFPRPLALVGDPAPLGEALPTAAPSARAHGRGGLTPVGGPPFPLSSLQLSRSPRSGVPRCVPEDPSPARATLRSPLPETGTLTTGERREAP